MQFNAGDTLKLTGKSGNFRTVMMLFPANSQTVIFTFVNCTDADSNHTRGSNRHTAMDGRKPKNH